MPAIERASKIARGAINVSITAASVVGMDDASQTANESARTDAKSPRTSPRFRLTRSQITPVLGTAKTRAGPTELLILSVRQLRNDALAQTAHSF